jgi:ABC-type polar amino acid transport system ATPase subunit
MMETLCLRNVDKRYIVSIGNKILIVTHDYHFAKRVEECIVKNNIIDEKYNVTLRRQK